MENAKSEIQKRKTDEMFRELGYNKKKQKDGEYILYESSDAEIQVDFKYNAVAKFGYDGIFDFSELHAVHRLLEEMNLIPY